MVLLRIVRESKTIGHDVMHLDLSDCSWGTFKGTKRLKDNSFFVDICYFGCPFFKQIGSEIRNENKIELIKVLTERKL
jgi:hypothetical protein